MIEFQVRTGSLIQSRQDEQKTSIQEALVPISQMMGAISDENKHAFEQVLMHLIERYLELLDIDFAQSASQPINDRRVIEMLKAAYMQIIDQNKAIEQLQQLAVAGLPQKQQPQQQNQQAALPQAMGEPKPQEQMQAGSSQLPPELMQQLLSQQQASNLPAEPAQPQIEQSPEQA